MPDWVTSGPLGLTLAFMFGVVFTRAQATYWIGRAIGEGAMRVDASVERTGVVVWFARHLRGDRMDSAVVKLRRYGGADYHVLVPHRGFSNVRQCRGRDYPDALAGVHGVDVPRLHRLGGHLLCWRFGGLGGSDAPGYEVTLALVAVLLITGGAIAFRIGRRRRRIVGPAEQTSQ
jgi:hypothetical protein